MTGPDPWSPAPTAPLPRRINRTTLRLTSRPAAGPRSRGCPRRLRWRRGTTGQRPRRDVNPCSTPSCGTIRRRALRRPASTPFRDGTPASWLPPRPPTQARLRRRLPGALVSSDAPLRPAPGVDQPRAIACPPIHMRSPVRRSDTAAPLRRSSAGLRPVSPRSLAAGDVDDVLVETTDHLAGRFSVPLGISPVLHGRSPPSDELAMGNDLDRYEHTF